MKKEKNQLDELMEEIKPETNPIRKTAIAPKVRAYGTATDTRGTSIMQDQLIDIKSPTGQGVFVTYNTVKLFRPQCGHRLDLHMLPKHRNCPWCWMAFWQNNGEAVKTADEMWSSEHPEALEQVIGKKGVKNFLAFMSTIANSRLEE